MNAKHLKFLLLIIALMMAMYSRAQFTTPMAAVNDYETNHFSTNNPIKGNGKKNNPYRVYIDINGKVLAGHVPTLASDRDRFQVLLVADDTQLDKKTFEFTYQGTYNTSVEIASGSALVAQKAGGDFEVYPFALIGPFSNSLSWVIKRTDSSGTITIYTHTAQLDTYNDVFISGGIHVTTVQAPENIAYSERVGASPQSDTTLTASGLGPRALYTVNLIFYPAGMRKRGLNTPWYKNFGALVGFSLNEDLLDNVQFGLSYRFANGFQASAGLHVAEVNRVAGDKDFEFGEDVFKGNIETDIVKRWQTGFVFGADIDIAVIGELLSKL